MSLELASSVCSTISELQASQADLIKRKVPASRSRQVNFTDAKQILQQEPVMAGMFTIDSHPAYVLFDSGASHSFMSMGFIDRHNIPLMAIPFAYRISTPGV